MATKKTKGKQKHLGFAESFKEILSGVGSSIKNDAFIPLPKESWAQFLGFDDADKHKTHTDGPADSSGAHAEHTAPHTDTVSNGEDHAKGEKKITSLSGVLAPGEWLNLLQITGPKSVEVSHEAPKSKNAAGIEYHRDIATSSEKANRREASEIEQKFQQIKQELNRMVESSNKIIQDEFGGVTIEQAPKEVKNYHINFLDWLLITISTARQKVEDSGAWLSAMRSKKSQRGYTSMAKSHGTSFTMSNERQVATQTG